MFDVLVSPGTFATSTETVVCDANGTCPRSLNVTDWSLPGLISCDLLRLRDRPALRLRAARS